MSKMSGVKRLLAIARNADSEAEVKRLLAQTLGLVLTDSMWYPADCIAAGLMWDSHKEEWYLPRSTAGDFYAWATARGGIHGWSLCVGRKEMITWFGVLYIRIVDEGESDEGDEG